MSKASKESARYIEAALDMDLKSVRVVPTSHGKANGRTDGCHAFLTYLSKKARSVL